MEEPVFIFHNVTISIPAPDAKTAYTNLCNGLAPIEGDWTTDTYSQEGAEDERSTSELFPEQL